MLGILMEKPHSQATGRGQVSLGSITHSSTLVNLSIMGPFRSTVPLFQTYVFNGQSFTYEQIVEISPLDRTLAQWSVLVDWDRQKRLPFVVIDPYDPRGLLYLSQNDYLSLGKVLESARKNLMVVARPGDVAPQPSSTSTSKTSGFSSKNSPWDIPWESNWNYSTKRYRRATISWTRFTEFRNSLFVNVARDIGEKMASGNYLTIARILYMWARCVLHYSGVDNPNAYLAALRPLAHQLVKIMRHNGALAGMTFLKVNLFVLYSFVCGNPVNYTLPLGIGIRMTNGLPSYWGKEIRHRIRQDNLHYVRIMASILNMYRGIKVKGGEASFKTISAPHPNLASPLLEQYKIFCHQILPTLLRKETGMKDLTFKYQSAIGLLMLTAGANASVGSLSMVRDAQAWASHIVDTQRDPIAQWLGTFGDNNLLMTYTQCKREWHQEGRGPNPLGGKPELDTTPTLAAMTGLYRWPKAICNANDNDTIIHNHCYDKLETLDGEKLSETELPKPALGRLHFINEPAGKVRVVAICDYWTQVCLKPLHDHLMSILRKISTDATFDQSGKVKEYFERGLSPHWSYDLKAATDTIPLGLYKIALRPLMTTPTASESDTTQLISVWAEMLTERGFVTPKGQMVHYTCGQPMGAYSSWASMAYVHHSLIQFAAWRANLDTTKWYRDYLVLGDDIDIAKSQLVADEYVNICGNFSIKIGMLKSLKSSKNSFEFANRRYHPLGDISPISLREEQSAQSWSSRISFAHRIVDRLGSKLKNKGLALARATLSYHQWEVLTGLRTADGAYDHTLASFVEFMVTNPLSQLVIEGSFVTLEGILNWLSLIIPQDGKSRFYQMTRSTTQLAGISYDLSIALLDHIDRLLKRKILEIPKEYKFLSRNPMGRSDLVSLPLNIISTYPPQLLKQSWETPKDIVRGVTRYDEDEYPHSHTGRAYLLYCMFKRNVQIMDSLQMYLARFRRIRDYIKDRELRKLEAFRATTIGTEGTYCMDSLGHQDFALNEVLRLYYDVLSTPDYVRTDPSKPFEKILIKEPTVTPGLQPGDRVGENWWKFEEILRFPIKTLAPILARRHGIFVPMLPLLNIRGDSNSNIKWSSYLRQMVNSYHRFHELRRNEVMTWILHSQPSWK